MDKKYLIERQGKTMVLYPGLLDTAHQRGLKRVATKLVQIPGPENGHVAICFAEVETEGGFFTGIGDASPENVGKMVANALIRMAETRAKARAFRDALNVGELLADDPTDDHDHTETPAAVRSPDVATPGGPGATSGQLATLAKFRITTDRGNPWPPSRARASELIAIAFERMNAGSGR